MDMARKLCRIVASGRAGRSAAGLCKPQSLVQAAGYLAEARHVVIVTGFFVPSASASETDGPPGAAVLARALHRTGVRVEVVTDKPNMAALAACCEALGMVPPGEAGTPGELFRSGPDVLVFVERLGAAADGCYYNMRGEDISSWTANLDEGAPMARERGIPVVAIGDGGNEAGMGCLRAELERLLPSFSKCLCRVEADAAVPADVSNWGAYALAALLSLRAGRWLGHGPEEEAAMIEGMMRTGAVDGVSCLPSASVDGMPLEVHCDVVARIRDACMAEIAKAGAGSARA